MHELVALYRLYKLLLDDGELLKVWNPDDYFFATYPEVEGFLDDISGMLDAVLHNGVVAEKDGRMQGLATFHSRFDGGRFEFAQQPPKPEQP